MSDSAVTARTIRDHLDIDLNHEAGLIPISTRILLENLADTMETAPTLDRDPVIRDLVSLHMRAAKHLPDALRSSTEDYLKRKGLARSALRSESGGDAGFQARVAPWMDACFGPEISADRLERGDRFLEEALELLQSGHYPPGRVAALRDYVWGRPEGEPAQEVGGVMVTLAAYCQAHGLDMEAAGEAELLSVWEKIDKIRAKRAAKPTGSALPC